MAARIRQRTALVGPDRRRIVPADYRRRTGFTHDPKPSVDALRAVAPPCRQPGRARDPFLSRGHADWIDHAGDRHGHAAFAAWRFYGKLLAQTRATGSGTG